MISVGNPSILSDFLSLFQPKCSYAVSMATGMHTDERSIDCFVLGHHDQDWKVSAKSVTMRAMTLCKNLSGYRELLIIRQTKCYNKIGDATKGDRGCPGC